MTTEPLLLSVKDLEIVSPSADGGAETRLRVSARFIVMGDADGVADLDEVADIIKARAEVPFVSMERTACEVRDEIKALSGVVSAVVSVKDVDTYPDAEHSAVSTLPDPRHAVLYGVLL